VEAGVDIEKRIKEEQPAQAVPALAGDLIKDERPGESECPEMSRFSLKDLGVYAG
jgi:hypothetical protein